MDGFLDRKSYVRMNDLEVPYDLGYSYIAVEAQM